MYLYVETMKTFLQILFLLSLNLSLFAQDCYTEATQENIKSDYCQLWQERTFQGTIGEDNQRIEIRFVEIAKDSESHFKYHVKGKSRVKNHVCNFQGTMLIDQIMLLDEERRDCNEPDLSEGIIYGTYVLNESPDENHAGQFTGDFKSMFDQSPYGFKLNTAWFGQDGFNSFMGTWESYINTDSGYCAWSLQIPPSKKENLFKHYDKEFYLFNSKYLNKGWKTYVLANLNTFLKVPKNFESNQTRSESDFMEFSEDEISKAVEAENIVWWN